MEFTLALSVIFSKALGGIGIHWDHGVFIINEHMVIIKVARRGEEYMTG
jgi:hypothetical protein